TFAPSRPRFPDRASARGRRLAGRADERFYARHGGRAELPEGLAGRCRGYETAAGLHRNPTASRDWTKPYLLQLRRLRINRRVSRRLHASGVRGETLDLSGVGGRFSAPFPESCCGRHLRRLAVRPKLKRLPEKACDGIGHWVDQFGVIVEI